METPVVVPPAPEARIDHPGQVGGLTAGAPDAELKRQLARRYDEGFPLDECAVMMSVQSKDPGVGFTFRPRAAKNENGVRFTSFAPAVSKAALKRMGDTVRGWNLHRYFRHRLRSTSTICAFIPSGLIVV